MTDENHTELLEACADKTKREIDELFAARFPKPDSPSTIRRLPETPSLALEDSAAPEPPARARVQPLSAGRYKVEFTASEAVRDKLDLARDLLSHANPSRDLAVVIERAVDLLIAKLRKQQFGQAERPHRARSKKPKSGRVTNATRREIAERDGERCSYVSPDGHRCEARAFLQIDHVEPRALGGSDEPDNTRLFCHAHNQLWAEQAYGREHVEKCRAAEIFEKARVALNELGFRPTEARRAVAEVERSCAGSTPAIEHVVRQSLIVATDRLGVARGDFR